MSEVSILEVLESLVRGDDPGESCAHDAFGAILDGHVSEAQVAALLTAVRLRGESPALLGGAVRAVRSRMIDPELPADVRPLLDTCGTGGDGARSFNVSTAVAIVVAACGVRVAKHGNRSASGNSGSAEVLSELGIEIEAGPRALARCLEEAGIAFLFAPRFHPALRSLAAVRKLLPFRTLFNLVGPLANPARPELQLIGVPDLALVPLFATTIQALAGDRSSRVALVHGHDSLDEVSLGAETTLAWVRSEDGEVEAATECLNPRDFGLGPVPRDSLRVSGPAESAARLRALLGGEMGPIRDVVLANCAVALRLSGRTERLDDGVAQAAEALDRGDAAQLLDRWILLSRSGE